MHDDDRSEITRWIERLDGDDSEALERLIPLLYGELRQLARRRLSGERAGHTLGTTGLVHEAYLRLRVQRRIGARDRAGFFAAAANTMRRILIDYARARSRQKRGCGQAPLSLDEVDPLLARHETEELLALDRALDRLETLQPRVVRVVEHRFFAGLGLAETAALLDVSTKTVQRDWIAGMAWLRKEVVGARDSTIADHRSAA